MKIAKKSLSVFLSFLMIITSCYVGIFGITASAVDIDALFEEDGSYTAAEVKSLLATAAAEYNSAGLTQNSGNALIYEGNYSMLTAVDALVSYALQTYVSSHDAKVENNSGVTLAAKLISALGITDATQKSIVNAIFDPAGTTIYSYSSDWSMVGSHDGTANSSNSYAANADMTNDEKIVWDEDSAGDVTQSSFSKTSTLGLSADGLSQYLLTFDSVDDIPKKISTRISVSFDYSCGKYAYAKSKSTNYVVTKSTKYRAYVWNYLSDVDLKVRTKNNKIKKTITDFVKYYDEEVLELTYAEMLEMSASDLYNYWLVANMKLESLDAQSINNTVRDHFLSVENGYNYSDVTTYIANLYKAYQINLAKDSIDILLSRIDTDYSEMTYVEMAELYGAVSSAYDVVAGIDSGILAEVVKYEGYQDKYNSAKAALTHSADYISALYKAMRKQHIIETRISMLDMIEQYKDIAADTNNLEDIDTTQLAAVISKADGINAILANYTAAEINEIISADERSEWNTLTTNLASKMAVRDDEAIYDSHLDYFLPYLTQDYTQLDNAALIDLHANAATKKTELVEVYNQFTATYGKDWTDALFTYTVNGKTDLLHNLIDSNYAASNSALQSYMTELNHVQVQTIVPYQGLPTVDFTNYTDIKAVLKHFDEDLYSYCAEQGWVSSADADIHSKVEPLLAAWKAFVATDGESQFKTVTYADAKGVYVTRYAGDQTVTDDEGNEIQIGYPNDIARDNDDKNSDGIVDDNFVVTETTIEDTITKIDKFIADRDFGALMNSIDNSLFADEEGNATDLKTYLSLIIDSICTDDMMNTMVVTIYPMLVDLLESQLKGLDMGGEKTIESASGAIAFETDVTLLGTVSGNLNLFLDQDLSSKGEHLQREFPEVFADLGLYVYPRTLAKFLAESDPAVFGPTTQIYKDLIAADKDWNYFTTPVDVLDEEGNVVAEAGTLYMNYEWGVADLDTFGDSLGIILDSIIPLIQAALGNITFEGSASEAAFIHGDITAGWMGTTELGAVAGLTLTIQPLNLWSKALVPVFEIFRLDDGGYSIPLLAGEFDGSDVAGALLGIVMELINQVTAAPLTKILTILPNLIYFLSMDSVSEILSQIVINLNLNASEVDIKSEYSGTLGTIASVADSLLGGLIKFDLPLDLGEMLDLDSMLDFELTSLNDIIQSLAGDLGLPKFDQNKFMFAAEFERYTSANGETNKPRLKGNPADVLYALFDYAISMLADPAFLTGLLGDTLDDTVGSILNQVIANVYTNPNGVIAALMEIINPREYELEEMDWIKQGKYDYNEIEGADNMSIVYLNYGNDWTRQDAEYLIDNIDAIVATVLEMTGSDIGDINTLIADAVNGIFTGDIFTSLVKALGSFGDSPSAIIDDIVSKQIGIDITVWFDAFGYLFSADTWAEDAVIVAPGEEGYTSTFANITATADAEGNITWYYAGEAYVDGDKEAFVNIMCELLDELELALGFLFGGADITAFSHLVQLNGYETYATTIGLLLELLGVENLPTQAQVTADPMEGFRAVLHAVVDWFDTLTASDNMIETILEIVPDLFYFIESNGLSTLIKNLIMPVLVIVDDVRPLFNVDINGILSIIVSELLNYGTFDINVLLQYLGGIYMNDDPEFKMINIDVNKITLTEIIRIVDAFLGTNLTGSGLKQIGLNGLCSGIVSYDSVSGTGYRTTVDAADTLTILLTAVIDCLAYPAQDTSKTNGDVILEFVADLTGNDDIAGIYSSISEIIAGIEYEYDFPNWGYMFPDDSMFSVQLPEQTVVYLGYTTDWDEETAAGVYGALNEILDLVLPMVLEEGETIATLLNGLLEDNVYSDEILNTVVELLVNLLADFDATLFELVDCVVDTDISAWFTYCELDETTGEYVCTYDWGVDEAAAADKKDMFIAGIKAVLEPANSLLAWLFFGSEYKFFTSSETDAEGNYTFADLITLNGGDGYAYGLAPIFEALGCTMLPAETFYDAATGTYNVGDAVEAILNSVLALVDEISANPVEEVFNLLPNLIYFINAGGVKVSVNNLLAPVNAILEKLSPIISEDGKEISLGALLADSIGFDICNITTESLLKIATDNGVVLSDEIVAIVSNLYVGNLTQFTAANGSAAYRLNVTGYEGDVLTIILSLALDLFNINADLFSDLLGEDTYKTVVNLIKGATDEFTYRDFNWGYMYEGETNADRLAALEAANGVLPDRTNVGYEVYTQYQNNWNEATAEYLVTVLDKLVDDITTAVTDDGSSLGMILDSAISDGLYQDSILNSLIELVVDLLVDYASIIEGAGVLLGAESIVNWLDYCEITTDENGDRVVTCVEDWGVDSAETIDEKRVAFVNAFVEVLEPAYDLLAWLFFGEDFTFFNGTTGENYGDPLITIKGGRGYDEALVPLFEAVGVLMKKDADGKLLSVSDTYLKGETAVYGSEEFYVNGELDMAYAVKTIFTAVADWLYDICGDLSNQAEDGTISSMLERLANVFYAVNADGLKVVVNNLVAPAMFLLETLEPMIGEIDFNELIGIEGMDIFDFDFDDLFALLADEDVLGLYFPDYTQEFLKSFYIGKLVSYTSANGDTAYYMTYTDEESEYDMITCVLGFVVDAIKDPRNDYCLIDWFGEDVYNGIMAVLGLTSAKDMQEFDWLFTDKADSDYVYNSAESSLAYGNAYNTIWTRDKAEYIADNLVPFVLDIFGLIGLEINGVEIKDLDDLLDTLLEGNLYTQATADSLLELVRDLVSKLTTLEPYGQYIVPILDKAFGVNLAAWDTMELNVEDGDRDSFVAALSEIVTPIVPLLNVLLCGENIELFYTIEEENIGKSALTIYGSEGYAYGIVPLFEALGCEMMDPATFKAIPNQDKVTALLNSLLDRVDVILQDPVNEIFAMLPEIIYFINSNGLDTAVNNILNAVDTVLVALQPILGDEATGLMDLLGVDLGTFDMDYLMKLAGDAIEESTGLEVEPVLVDFVAELTMGKVISYTSANGETYYKMVYAGENQFADMITVLLRLVVEFLATGDNADAIIALLAGNAESEEAADSSATLIKAILKGLNTEPSTSGAMAVIYYIFYGLNNAVSGVDELYGNYGDSWDSLIAFFEESDDSVYDKLVTFLKNVIKEFGGVDADSAKDDCDCDCHNKSAFIRFFFKIANFFRKLFGMKQFQFCDCGEAHW